MIKKLSGSTIDILESADAAREDAASKQILKDRFFLACILKAVVSEYRHVSEQDIAFKYIEEKSIRDDIPVSKNLTNQDMILGSAEEDTTVNEGIIKYDVIFEATVPINVPVQKYKHKKKGPLLTIRLKIDLEAQLKYDAGYPISKRSMFYCARMLSSQFHGKVESTDYQNLYKVYSIWLCFDPPAYLANTITRFKIAKEDVMGKAEIPETDYNLMESVIIRLGMEDESLIQPMFQLLYALFGTNPRSKKITKLKELGYSGTSLEQEVKNMMTFSERTYNQGIEQGMERGLERGLERGQLDMLNLLLRLKKMREEGHSLSEMSSVSGLSEAQLKQLFD